MSPDRPRLTLRDFVPPVVIRLFHWLRYVGLREREWEYATEGWDRASERLRGWDVRAVAERQAARWPALASAISGQGPLSLNHEAVEFDRTSVGAHNTLVSYAYVASLAAGRSDGPLSILDWGGGIGQYALLTRSVLPGVAVDYHVVDVPAMCRVGRGMAVDVTFHEERSTYIDRRFDLVLASSSLQYVRDWRAVARDLALLARHYVYVTRMPVVDGAESFPVVQRPYQHGYDTEYVGWFLNRREVVATFIESGLELVREFLIDERPHVPGAPEQAHYAGFLFRAFT